MGNEFILPSATNERLFQMINLSAGWYTYRNKLVAMFDGDPQVQVKDLSDDGDGKYSVDIIVNDDNKFSALNKILVNTVSFGNNALNVNVLSMDKNKVSTLKETSDDVVQLYESALSGNKAFIKIETTVLPAFPATYCILEKSVVQFYNDDLSDYYHNWNGLFSDIAKEIFNIDEYKINFCTDITQSGK